ncbi:hypothetical protein B9Z55_022887 [Caenorhabditis nigoni]|uniref:Uncharacterized protein n=1 Tax=Caenorhabditis nigoni TaxID=1611254 RepID=A0A2G5SMF2_9PELO|nr:hypothetical protein B9Z55_022887 [Caenorhabditis nigoni]
MPSPTVPIHQFGNASRPSFAAIGNLHLQHPPRRLGVKRMMEKDEQGRTWTREENSRNYHFKTWLCKKRCRHQEARMTCLELIALRHATTVE